MLSSFSLSLCLIFLLLPRALPSDFLPPQSTQTLHKVTPTYFQLPTPSNSTAHFTTHLTLTSPSTSTQPANISFSIQLWRKRKEYHSPEQEKHAHDLSGKMSCDKEPKRKKKLSRQSFSFMNFNIVGLPIPSMHHLFLSLSRCSHATQLAHTTVITGSKGRLFSAAICCLAYRNDNGRK